MTLNKVQLIGRLGKDPEVRHVNSGDRVVQFSLATSERWRDKEGNRQEKTEWHNVVIWNQKLGEIAETYLKKGKEVYIEGQIQSREYDKDGERRKITEIVLPRFGGDIKLIGPKDDDNASQGDFPDRRSQGPTARNREATRPQGTVESGRAALKGSPFDELDDDIPF